MSVACTLTCSFTRSLSLSLTHADQLMSIMNGDEGKAATPSALAAKSITVAKVTEALPLVEIYGNVKLVSAQNRTAIYYGRTVGDKPQHVVVYVKQKQGASTEDGGSVLLVDVKSPKQDLSDALVAEFASLLK